MIFLATLEKQTFVKTKVTILRKIVKWALNQSNAFNPKRLNLETADVTYSAHTLQNKAAHTIGQQVLSNAKSMSKITYYAIHLIVF